MLHMVSVRPGKKKQATKGLVDHLICQICLFEFGKNKNNSALSNVINMNIEINNFFSIIPYGFV